jgi:hypothetical protein
MTKPIEKIIEDLQAPTPGKEIKFYGISPKNNQAVAIPYVDMVFVAGRLDEACGPMGWQSDIRLSASGEIAMGISILNPESGEWLSRWDTGDDGKKQDHGSLEIATRAMKRAASQWGVARDLRDIPKLRVRCNSYTSGGKEKWSGWREKPIDVIERFIAGKQNGTGAHRGADEGSDAQDEGKSDKEPTVDEARGHVIRLLMSDAIGYTSQQASKYIMDQDNGLPDGERPTVQYYRDMYKRLKDSNTPPE